MVAGWAMPPARPQGLLAQPFLRKQGIHCFLCMQRSAAIGTSRVKRPKVETSEAGQKVYHAALWRIRGTEGTCRQS